MKCGLEIHQRLAGGKLFCRCHPSEGGSAIEFTRRLHAVRSELGEIDAAVRMESSRNRSFRYVASNSSSCLVEADEEPPHPLNPSSLRSVLIFSHLLSSRPVQQLHIMRKNVIDGSNTSGFQRTALVALGGGIETPAGRLGVQTICVEEESSGILEGKEHEAKYDLSRLGIPLVEIATTPDLKSGKEAEEAALAIGTLLRKTGLVARGIGTIRQDLNVSIPEGARVEIKGVQELSMIAQTVELEVQRQERLLAINREISSRTGGKPIIPSFIDLTETFSETRSQMVSKLIKKGSRVVGMKLPGLSGLLGRELGPNRRFGSELADYARSCGVSGLIHSDEGMEKYGFSDDEIAEVRVALSMGELDAYALVITDGEKARAALSEVSRRASMNSIPEETRRANPDGTSSYMRPLPGRARLYPETDLPPIEISPAMLKEAAREAERIGEMQEEQEKTLSAVNPELASQLSALRNLISHSPSHKLSAQTPELSAFSAAIERGADPKFAASVLTNTLQGLKREGAATTALDEERLLSALVACKDGMFAKSAMQEILREMCADASATPKKAAEKLNLSKITGKALAKLVEEEKLDMKGLMAKYRLRVDAAEAQELLK